MNTIQTLDSPRSDFAQLSQLTCYALIVMFFLGVFAEFTVRNQLIDWSNAEVTFMSIQNSLLTYELGIAAWIIIISIDVYLAIAFYLLFSNHNRTLTLLMAVFRIVYVMVKGSVIVTLVVARDLVLLSPNPVSAEFKNLADQTLQLLKTHHYGFAVGLIFFGIHLMLLGRIVFKVSSVPKVISLSVMLAGVGYIINSLIGLSGADHNILLNVVLAVFIIPMSFSELALGIWLYKRGSNLLLH